MSAHPSTYMMRCGHGYGTNQMRTIIENTLRKSSTVHEFKCPEPGCGITWELDECATAAQLNDDDYLKLAEEIEKRAPITKPCPTCKTECEQVQEGRIRIHCPSYTCYEDWCWLCSSRWLNKFSFTNCGNILCESYASGNGTGYNYTAGNATAHDRGFSKQNTASPPAKATANNNNAGMHGNNVPDAGNEDNANNADNDGMDDDEKDGAGDKSDSDEEMVDISTKTKDTKKDKRDKPKKQNNKTKNKKTKQNTKPIPPPKPIKRSIMTRGLVGLRNLGNTCFMNSALQTMLKTPQFIPLFFNDEVQLPSKSSYGGWKKSVDKSSLTYIWSQFVKEIYTTNSRYIAPYDIKRALNRLRSCIGDGRQQDAFYVISTLLQALDEELCSNESEIEHEVNIYKQKKVPSMEQMQNIAMNKVWKPYVSRKNENDNSCIIREIFNGIECETLSCCQCNFQSKIFRPFREIELPLVDKLINLTIKVYVPQINKKIAKQISLQLAYDNTLNGLKFLILAKLDESESEKFQKLNKESFSVKIGYIHSSNNRNNGKDINKWFKYLNDENSDCSKIPNHSQLIALVYDNGGNNHDDDEKMDGAESAVYIPRFNLICNEKDAWMENYIDDMIFTPFWPRNARVSGKEIIEKERKISPKFVREDYTFTVFYDNCVVHPESTISITKNGCLLCIWVHKQYKNKSPALDPNISFAEGDGIIVGNAMSSVETKSSGCAAYGWEVMKNAVSHYYNKIPTFSLSSVLPGYTPDMDQRRKKQIQKQKAQAKETMDKLETLSSIEKLANKWLNMRLSGVLETAEKDKINITSPRTLNNVSECLQTYESNEVSDANIMECLRCDDCPEAVSRQVQVLKTPNVLILHIDRYGDDNDGGYYGKKNNMIKYPVYNLTFKDSKYNLYGVVVHHGGNDGGHYIGYAKNLNNNQWNCMNDSSVSPANEMRIMFKDATVLLYYKANRNNQ